mmetsp:Transcript_26764/g.32842  ORF Transcript_26764/g.32842 Transcript_26764/m.32842 type:complete len:117 (+) Transcript_26764:1995-2345(+)
MLLLGMRVRLGLVPTGGLFVVGMGRDGCSFGIGGVTKFYKNTVLTIRDQQLDVFGIPWNLPRYLPVDGMGLSKFGNRKEKRSPKHNIYTHACILLNQLNHGIPSIPAGENMTLPQP